MKTAFQVVFSLAGGQGAAFLEAAVRRRRLEACKGEKGMMDWKKEYK